MVHKQEWCVLLLLVEIKFCFLYVHTEARKLFSKIKLEIRLIHLAGIKSLSNFKDTQKKKTRSSMIIFLPYYIPFYSSYLTKLNLYKFVHIALKELVPSLKRRKSNKPSGTLNLWSLLQGRDQLQAAENTFDGKPMPQRPLPGRLKRDQAGTRSDLDVTKQPLV